MYAKIKILTTCKDLLNIKVFPKMINMTYKNFQRKTVRENAKRYQT